MRPGDLEHAARATGNRPWLEVSARCVLRREATATNHLAPESPGPLACALVARTAGSRTIDLPEVVRPPVHMAAPGLATAPVPWGGYPGMPETVPIRPGPLPAVGPCNQTAPPRAPPLPLDKDRVGAAFLAIAGPARGHVVRGPGRADPANLVDLEKDQGTVPGIPAGGAILPVGKRPESPPAAAPARAAHLPSPVQREAASMASPTPPAPYSRRPALGRLHYLATVRSPEARGWHRGLAPALRLEEAPL